MAKTKFQWKHTVQAESGGWKTYCSVCGFTYVANTKKVARNEFKHRHNRGVCAAGKPVNRYKFVAVVKVR